MEIQIAGASKMALEGQALIESKTHSTSGLYFPIDDNSGMKDLDIRLNPYHAWGNRGSSEMSVWMNPRPQGYEPQIFWCSMVLTGSKCDTYWKPECYLKLVKTG